MKRQPPGYLKHLTDFLASVSAEEIAPQAWGRARWVLADSIAAIAGGSAEPEVQDLTHRFLPKAGGPATLIGTTRQGNVRDAAFVNGTAGTFLELDEGNQFCRGHPGIHVVPAVLAYAEEQGCSGKDVLRALILGYEVGARIGIACKLRMSMHPHGTWGTVAAAVGVGSLAGFRADDLAELINISSSLGLATSRKTMLEGGTVRNSFAGVSNQLGLVAHDLLRSGFTGEQDGLSTVFGSVVSETFAPEEMTRELGSRWEIARNYFKLHACCRYNHGALDALDQILRSEDLAAEDVLSVVVETYSLAAQLADQNPQNTLAGKFSVPFAIATTLVNRSSGVSSFTWDQIRRQQVQELAARVEVVEVPELTAMMPDFRPARVHLTLKDGTELHAETQTNRGDSEDPYSEQELREKFLNLTQRAWRLDSCAALHQQLLEVDQLPDIRPLMGQIRNAATEV